MHPSSLLSWEGPTSCCLEKQLKLDKGIRFVADKFIQLGLQVCSGFGRTDGLLLGQVLGLMKALSQDKNWKVPFCYVLAKQTLWGLMAARPWAQTSVLSWGAELGGAFGLVLGELLGCS